MATNARDRAGNGTAAGSNDATKPQAGEEGADPVLDKIQQVWTSLVELSNSKSLKAADKEALRGAIAKLVEAGQLCRERSNSGSVSLSRNELCNLVLGLLHAGKAIRENGESDPIRPLRTQ